jgi:hypothetical protein
VTVRELINNLQDKIDNKELAEFADIVFFTPEGEEMYTEVELNILDRAAIAFNLEEV